MIIGSHVQMKAPDFLLGSVKEALSYHANACMLYTGAPQNTRRRPISEMKAEEARSLMAENNLPMERMIIHAPYIINPANSVKPEVAQLAVEFLQQEVERTHEIGARYLVLHPGSYTTTDLKTGIETICRQLNLVNVPEDVVICLETMAGKGSEVGFAFEQLAEILGQLKQTDRYGVCMDTCHINDAGYDLHDFDGVLDSFDSVIGLKRLHVIHLNDSKNDLGARKDRHANIGQGTIGFDILHSIAVNPRVESVAKILETPYINEQPPYGIEIDMLKSGIYDPKRLEL
jgi:deoxyribonuclease-4